MHIALPALLEDRACLHHAMSRSCRKTQSSRRCQRLRCRVHWHSCPVLTMQRREGHMLCCGVRHLHAALSQRLQGRVCWRQMLEAGHAGRTHEDTGLAACCSASEAVSQLRSILLWLPQSALQMRGGYMYGTGFVIACNMAASCGGHSVGMPCRPGEEAKACNGGQVSGSRVMPYRRGTRCRRLAAQCAGCAVQRWLVQHTQEACSSRLSAGAVDVTSDNQPSRNNRSSEHTCNDGSRLQRLAQAHILHQCAIGCHARMRMQRVICQHLLR